MPLYEYACKDCVHRFEVRQGIRDEALIVCPHCGGAIRRVVQPVGIVFKGSGFYKTDSRTSSEPSAPAAERTPEAAAKPAEGEAAPAKKEATTPAPASSDSSKPASTTTSSPASPATTTPS